MERRKERTQKVSHAGSTESPQITQEVWLCKAASHRSCMCPFEQICRRTYGNHSLPLKPFFTLGIEYFPDRCCIRSLALTSVCGLANKYFCLDNKNTAKGIYLLGQLDYITKLLKMLSSP